MIDIKSLIAFRDEMTKIAAKPPNPVRTDYARDTGQYMGLPPGTGSNMSAQRAMMNPTPAPSPKPAPTTGSAKPVAPKQVAAPKQPKVRKFKIPKNYQAPTTLKGANYRQRGMFIQSMGFNPRAKRGDKDDWRKNKKIRGMMNEWWKDRNARRAAAKANKNAGPAPAITPGKANTAFQGQKLSSQPAGPGFSEVFNDFVKNLSNGGAPVPKTPPKSVPAASSASQGIKPAPQSSQPAGPGGQVAPTARPKAQPKAIPKAQPKPRITAKAVSEGFRNRPGFSQLFSGLINSNLNSNNSNASSLYNRMVGGTL